MRKKFGALLAMIGLVIAGFFAGTAPASAVTAEDGHNVGVVIGGAIDWKFTVQWDTYYSSVTPTVTEPHWLMVCQNGTIGTKKKATSLRMDWRNGRTGALVNRKTYNFGAGPTSTCNTFDIAASPSGQTTRIAVADIPTLNIEFWSGADLTGTKLGTVTGYEYL